MSAFKFGQDSEPIAGFALRPHGQPQEFPFYLMEDEIGPHYKDYDDGGFVFLNDALQRLQNPLSKDTREEFRQRLIQHFENPEEYPTRFWLRDYLYFEGVVQRHDPIWNTKYGAWSQRRNRPSEDEDYPDFRRKMALRLMTNFRKDELEYTLAYWKHYPLNNDDGPKISGLFNHLFTKAMEDHRYNLDDTNEKASYRLIMALLLGAANKVPWIRDYWVFNPYVISHDRESDPPQVHEILLELGGEPVQSATVSGTQSARQRFRIEMIHSFGRQRWNLLLGAYWKYHKINPSSSLDDGRITELFTDEIINRNTALSGPSRADYAMRKRSLASIIDRNTTLSGPSRADYANAQRRKRSLALDEKGAFF